MKRGTFFKGILDGIPICLGYLSVGFAFGIFAVDSGLTVLESVLISMTNVTSAGQLAGVPIIASGGSFVELGLTQLIINLRYSLMSVSLSQKLDETVTVPHRLAISFVNTDEVFAVASSNKGKVGKKYLYGLILTPYFGWSIGTLVGAVSGNIFPDIITSSLGIAIYGMFIAIIIPETKTSKMTGLCVALAILLGCIFKYTPVLNQVPSGFVIIICSILASAVFAVLSPVQEEVEVG